MKRNVFNILYILFGLALVLLASCQASPPITPTESFNPYLAPSTPAKLEASNGLPDSIELKWEAVEGATGYMVWATPVEDYGTTVQDSSITDAYSKLMARGFKLIEVVTEPNYKLTEQQSDTSYIFSIVAMKTISGKSASTTTLYSDPSEFVQGATASQIILSAIANSKTVTLYWDITNLYSALDNEKDPTALYSYKVSIYKKLSSKNDWGEAKELDDQTAKKQSFSFSASAVELDTPYDFKIHIDILDADGEIINSVESQAFTLTTDALPVPDSVDSTTISANNGKKRNEVTLTWTAPQLPLHDTIVSAFIVERAEGNVSNSEDVTWTTISAPITQNADGTYSLTDTSLKDNTTYTYRIISGYQIGEKTPAYQNKEDASIIQNVYSLWIPENINFTFTPSSDNKSAEITVSYTYNPPVKEGMVKTYIGGSYWTENDLSESAHVSLEEKEVEEGKNRKVELSQLRPLNYFSLYFKFTLDDEEVLKYTNPTDFTLGETSAVKTLISNFTATENWVKEIRLSWQEDKEGCTYEIYKDNKEISDYTIESDTSNSKLKSVLLQTDDGQTHNFRIKAKYTDSSGDSFQVEETTGTTLDIPTGLSATDGTSATGINVTWPEVNDANVKYVLQYSEDNGTTWTELATATGTGSEGSATKNAKGNGTDGNKILFKLVVSNTAQTSAKTLESTVESGSVFGPALLNVRIENNGLDPDKVTIKWDEIEGASYYQVKRGDTLLLGKKTEGLYEDSVDYIKALDGEYPLNEEYTYTVIPYMADGTEANNVDASSAAKATGKLFAPPTNIKATKGQDGITLTWDPIEHATGYEIQKYIVKIKNGQVTAQVEGEKIATTSTSYDEISSSLLNQNVLYKVRSVKEDGTVSQWQEKYKTTTNSLGFTEAENIGYRLQAPTNLSIEAVTVGNYYADYVKFTWYMVPGATSYTLISYTSSGQLGSTTISVDELSYSEIDTVDNGKTGKDYFSYDPENMLYTYYDGSGSLKGSYEITSYSIIANNGSLKSSTTTRDNISVYRQPTAKEWVNIVANVLRPAFVAANSNFGGDWWINNAKAWSSPTKSYTYPNTGMVFNLKTNGISASYPNSENYLAISSYKDTNTKLTINTTSNIQFDISEEDEAGNLGTDPLKLIGSGGNGTISVTPEDSKLKSFTIKYNNVYVSSVSGTYTVTISGSSAVDISDSSDITRVL